jgi:NAD-dependent SIR2 family protein deacetylase
MTFCVPTNIKTSLERVAQLIAQADSLIITTGAGMGVDSGLPDFRGTAGFWQAYPALARSGLRFEEIANPEHFITDPELAWGFYGHRLNLYRATIPHQGFHILQKLAGQLPYGAFVFTSNVDGQFQKSGIDPLRMLECHGSIHHLQCTTSCGKRPWSADGFNPTIDSDNCRITSPLPTCPNCGSVARPNILMFGDSDWLSERKTEQQQRFLRWRERVQFPVVIELGAGTAIPSVRWFGEGQHCPLIRINPREFEVPRVEDVSIPLGALAGLAAINEMIT